MLFTTFSTYGLRAVFDLAYHGGGQPIPIRVIAGRQQISERYLEQIFHKLRTAGLLKSKRGPHGGYMLSRDASEISLGDILEAAEGPIVPVSVDCLVEDEWNGDECRLFDQCITKYVWRRTQRLLEEYYASVSIADLCAFAKMKGVTANPDQGYLGLDSLSYPDGNEPSQLLDDTDKLNEPAS
ncbi:RrF2 family transcriptional regulator [Thermodesulfobacteriota bacterium]